MRRAWATPLRPGCSTCSLNRRQFLGHAGLSLGALSLGALSLPGCDPAPTDRYTQADIDTLAAQRTSEQQYRGKSIHGKHVYPGYRGLAELPWFGLDETGQLICIDDSVPMAIDVHCHLGMSFLLSPSLDLTVSTPRVKHLLDSDATDPGSPFDLDVYANGNDGRQKSAKKNKPTIPDFKYFQIVI